MKNESLEVIDARAEALVDALDDLKRDLVALRERHGLTQPDVAERLGMTQSAVSQFERYDSNPTLRSLRHYALAVGARLNIEVIDDWDPGATGRAPDPDAMTGRQPGWLPETIERWKARWEQ